MTLVNPHTFVLQFELMNTPSTSRLANDPSISRLLEKRREAVAEFTRLGEEAAQIAKQQAHERESIEALDKVLRLFGIDTTDLQADTDDEIAESPTRESESSAVRSDFEARYAGGSSTKKIRLAPLIRYAIGQFDEDFTQQDIVRWIKSKHPSAEVRPATVSSTLWRLAQKDAIEKVREGYGSEPNTYRKTAQEGTAQEEFPSGENAPDEEPTVSE